MATRFPVALTSFVGRAQVVDEIAGQLDRHRLVTVAAPGGAGKTRLAGQVARRVAGRFADGVWLAELAAVRDPAQVAAAVAAALGIRNLPALAAADALAHALARRQLLLVLDNCEQVIGAAAELCGRLLLGADERRIFRAVSAFPGPFTLDGAEAVAGPGAGQTVPRLVDCSLLIPPHAGPDDRSRYAMLETLRAYGAGLLAEKGEEAEVTAALAAYAADLAERELVTLVTQGRTDAQIAAQLYITVRTVGSHLDRIRDKTGCRRRADLTRLALSAGLV
jgi:predicted ATPase